MSLSLEVKTKGKNSIKFSAFLDWMSLLKSTSNWGMNVPSKYYDLSLLYFTHIEHQH